MLVCVKGMLSYKPVGPVFAVLDASNEHWVEAFARLRSEYGYAGEPLMLPQGTSTEQALRMIVVEFLQRHVEILDVALPIAFAEVPDFD